MWNGYFFQASSLTDLGLFLLLGHDGHPCPIPTNIYTRMTILHVNGIHTMNVKFCTCARPTPPPRRVQLLQARLFPATVVQPQTCATFEVLRHAHLLTLQSKISAHNYYSTLERLTDNAGITTIKVHVIFWFDVGALTDSLASTRPDTNRG